MTLLDFEKAFDAVWYDALRHKLFNLGLPVFLVKIVSSFLKNRKSLITVNKTHSMSYSIPAGVPRGSPLSPFLFNYFINDVTQNCMLR